MANHPTDLARKVRQLDNDVQSIYEMLAGIAATQQRHGNRLDEISAEMSGYGARLDEISTELASHGDQLGSILDILRRERP